MDERPNAPYDVIVIGLGAMGSATVCELARRGLRVLGLERFTPAHDQGSSHGDTRIIRQAYFEHPDYVPLLKRTYALWDALAAETGTDLFVRTGALMIGAPDSAVVAGTLASVDRWSLPHEYLDRAAMAERFPQFALRDGEVAVHETDAGYLDPEAGIRAHLDRATHDGADLRFETIATSWHAGDDGVTVETATDTFRAAKLVLAAGAWTSGLVPQLTVPLRVERRVMHFLAPPAGAEPFEAGRFPVYVWEIAPGDDIYGFPLVGPPDAGVKAGFHHRGGPLDPDHVDRTVTPAEQDELRSVLAELIPGLAGPHVDARVCFYTLTPDENFVIDLLPGTDGRVVVAATCSGHGYKFAPVIGEILADLAVDGRTDHPIEFLSLARFA